MSTPAACELLRSSASTFHSLKRVKQLSVRPNRSKCARRPSPSASSSISPRTPAPACANPSHDPTRA
eukprot:4859267-Pyramimonas_sp.AAC.1